MLRRQDSRTPGMRPRKLDRRLHSFASRRTKEGALQSSPSSLAKFFSKFSCQVGDVGLNHGRPAAPQFLLKRRNHVRMVVPDVVNAVSGKKIQNPSAVRHEEIRTYAELVPNVRLQQTDKPLPGRIYSLR